MIIVNLLVDSGGTPANLLILYGLCALVKGMKQNYGDRLAAALKLRNFKQSDLAKELNITQAAVSKIINGSQYLDFDLAVKACEVLEISLDWLAYGVDMETKPPFYRNPERQRIEYFMSIMKEAEYPLVIVAMEEIIEIRLRDAPAHEIGRKKLLSLPVKTVSPAKPDAPSKSGKNRSEGKEGSKKSGKTSKG
jgi:transcriptional regulator with XRE-family HTH domain